VFSQDFQLTAQNKIHKSKYITLAIEFFSGIASTWFILLKNRDEDWNRTNLHDA